jgi:hypothetical protein
MNAVMEVIDANAGIVRSVPQRTKVIIIAAGSSKWEHLDLLEDPSYEVWGCNAIPVTDRAGRFRADRWFELHPIEAQTDEEMVWIRNCPKPFYMFMPRVQGEMTPWEASIFNAKDEQAGRDGRNFIDPRTCGLTETLVRYPMDRACHINSFFACTFGYQIALAMMEGFEEIALLGCDLANGTQRERSLERACVMWWAGYAQGRGTKIWIPPKSTLDKHPYLYGASYWTEARFGREYCDILREQEVAL